MIAASILFLAAAIVTFLVGVFSSGLQMIGVSIGCSVAAAALLLTGVLRDSRRRPAVTVGAGAGVSQADVSTYATPSFRDEVAAVEPAELEPVYETAAVEEEDESDLWSQEEEPSEEPSWLPELTPEPAPKRAARKPAARKTAAKKAAPKKAAPKKAAPRKTAAKSTAKKAAPKSAAKKAAPKKAAPRKPSGR